MLDEGTRDFDVMCAATCKQFQAWKVENGQADAKFTQWAKQNTKPCPKCKHLIEKNGGCVRIQHTRSRSRIIRAYFLLCMHRTTCLAVTVAIK